MRGLVRVGAAGSVAGAGEREGEHEAPSGDDAGSEGETRQHRDFPGAEPDGVYLRLNLFFQRRLLDDVTDALLAIKDEMPEGILAVVGAPLEI